MNFKSCKNYIEEKAASTDQGLPYSEITNTHLNFNAAVKASPFIQKIVKLNRYQFHKGNELFTKSKFNM